MATLFAPAKINLTLEILARREDGYHTLRSVMVPIGLYDRIALEPAARASFRANVPGTGDDNLVLRALAAAGIGHPLRVELEKAIPIGGGLGGGSSDAAAVLRAAMEGTFGPPAERDWVELARNLGSDVPFFLQGTAALVEGTGERVTALGALPSWWVVTVRPPVSVSTAEAYRALDEVRGTATRSRPRASSASLAAVDALQRRDFAALRATLLNDFHDVVLAQHEPIARADAALRASGAEAVLLSGSGSCVFALFENEAEARASAARFDPAAAAEIFVSPFHHDPGWR
ncbi:MAG TPA: 4-(cytidine 5'-diphospho)-2-C-methyl-D-erythritol kinase [Candidatus Baltobacteraceae bacterium]|nr:4-(cytidine 5'-diphospho)-2-C-methyl-D-erythritol kinase [Candidatus Baltobacteraceae bacterium]